MLNTAKEGFNMFSQPRDYYIKFSLAKELLNHE